MLKICGYRQKTSGAEGERLKEAANINKSLSTLGCDQHRLTARSLPLLLLLCVPVDGINTVLVTGLLSWFLST